MNKSINELFAQLDTLCPRKAEDRRPNGSPKKFGTMSGLLSEAASKADLVAKLRKEVACRPERLSATLLIPDVQDAIASHAGAISRPQLTAMLMLGAGNLSAEQKQAALEAACEQTRSHASLDLATPELEELAALAECWDVNMDPRPELQPVWRERLFADHANNTLTRRMAKRFDVYSLDIPAGWETDTDLGDSVFETVAAAIAATGQVTWEQFESALVDELEKLDNPGVSDTIPEPDVLEKLFN